MKELVSSVTGKGQVTIPREIRRRLGIGTPDKVAFVVSDDGTVELRLARFTVASLRGVVAPLPGPPTVDFEDQIADALAEGADRKVRELEGR